MCVWSSFQTEEAPFAALGLTFYVTHDGIFRLMTGLRSTSDSSYLLGIGNRSI